LGNGFQRFGSGYLWVGIKYIAVQTFPAKYNNKAVLFARFNDHFDVFNFFNLSTQHRTKTFAFFRGNTTSAPISKQSFRIHRCEITTCGNITRLQLHI